MSSKYKYQYNDIQKIKIDYFDFEGCAQSAEFQEELGLNWNDYGARNYDPAIGRWMNVDPMAHKYFSHSPYNYVGDNPLVRTDPDGMIWDDPLAALNLLLQAFKRKEQLRRSHNSLLRQRESISSNSNLSDKDRKKQLKKVDRKIGNTEKSIKRQDESISNIAVLGADPDNTYVLTNSTTLGGGRHGVRKGSDGKVYIEGSNASLHLHEIDHVAQALRLNGGGEIPSQKPQGSGGFFSSEYNNYLAFNLYPNGQNKLEIIAYQIGYAQDNSSFPGSVNHITEINAEKVGEIRDNNGKLIYPHIRNNAVRAKVIRIGNTVKNKLQQDFDRIMNR